MFLTDSTIDIYIIHIHSTSIFVLRTRLTDLLICFYDIYIYQAQMKYRNIFIFGQITFCKKKKKKRSRTSSEITIYLCHTWLRKRLGTVPHTHCPCFYVPVSILLKIGFLILQLMGSVSRFTIPCDVTVVYEEL